jgi:hypothetical protein
VGRRSAVVTARGEHDDRDFGEVTKEREQREAVDLRHHDVEENALGRPVAHGGETVGAVDGRADLKAGLDEGHLDHVADRAFVIHDEHAMLGCCTHTSDVSGSS